MRRGNSLLDVCRPPLPLGRLACCEAQRRGVITSIAGLSRFSPLHRRSRVISNPASNLVQLQGPEKHSSPGRDTMYQTMSYGRRNLLIGLYFHIDILYEDEFVCLLKPVDAPLDSGWDKCCGEDRREDKN